MSAEQSSTLSSLIRELQAELWPWRMVEVKNYVIYICIYFMGFTFSDDILKRTRKIARRHNFTITGFRVDLRRGRLLIALIIKEKKRRTK